jgi:hypothetical protein
VRDRIRIFRLAVSGEVLSGGNDWQRARSDSCIELDVRLLLKTTNDALTDRPAVIRALDRAEIVDPVSFYFSLSGLFETSAPPYDWLDRVIAISIGNRPPGGPISFSKCCDFRRRSRRIIKERSRVV